MIWITLWPFMERFDIQVQVSIVFLQMVPFPKEIFDILGKVGATGESTMHWTVKINGDPNVNLPTEVFRDAYIPFHKDFLFHRFDLSCNVKTD